LFQAGRGNKRVTAVMAFAGKDNRLPGMREKLLDRTRYARARAVHKRFDFHPVCERGLFRRPHRRGAYDR
jgi:hypothetical protein